MQSAPKRRFFIGQNVDVLDSVKRWLNGEVLKVTPHQLLVHYTGWSTKFDEWLPLESERVLVQWEQGKEIQLNNRLDVRHEIGGWLESRVIELGEGTRVRVHFNRYHPKYDMWVDLADREHVAEIGKHSKAYGIGKRRSKFVVKLNELILGTQGGYSAKLKKTDTELRASLQQCNLVVKEVAGDGNCLFRSISDQLYGCEDYHLQIRALCLDYIQHEQYFFQDYIEGDFHQYVTRKRMDGCWGDDVELQAISQLYDRPIEIFVNGSTPIKTFHEQNDKKVVPIKLAYHGSCHYNSIKTEDHLNDGILQQRFGEYERGISADYSECKRKRELYRDQFAQTSCLDEAVKSIVDAEQELKQNEDLNEEFMRMAETDQMLDEIEQHEIRQLQLQAEEARLREELQQIEARELESARKQSLQDMRFREEAWVQGIREQGFSDEQIMFAISARGNDPDAVLNYLYDHF